MANNVPATSTETNTGSRTGSQLTVDKVTTTQSWGDFVTDVSLNPYIAPRIISFYAYNMRPNTRMHIFFDNVNVDDHCAPGIIPSKINNTSDPNSIVKNGVWGANVMSDAFGQVAGQFNVPATTFRTGERTMIITDVDNLSLGGDALTTSCSATFTASNLSVKTKTQTLTSVTPEMSFTELSDQTISISKAKDILNVNVWYEPLAQALTINTPNGEAGIYVTSLDVFFKQKPQSNNASYPNGVTVYLCEMDNGYPNGKSILPFATVHKLHSEIQTSNNASLATTFYFEAPVYLANDTEYAFIVKPDNNDPDYYVWTARLGDTDVGTNYQVFSQPVLGTAYYGATMSQWTALPTEYVKFSLRRAKFTGTSATAVFNNSDIDFLPVFNISNTSVLPGDIVFQAVNSSISGITTAVNGTLYYYDPVKEVFYVHNSSGTFNSNSFIQVHRFPTANISSPNTSTLICTANTGSIYNPKVHSLVGQIAAIVPPGTALTFEYSGTSNSYVKESITHPINLGYETDFSDNERIVASRSNEVSNMNGTKSFTMTANLVTDSDYLSPMIDLVKNNQLVIANQVEGVSFDYQEFLNNGNQKSKYISKVVTLADGQDAEDLNVIISAYRPPGSDIQVWCRFLNSQDTESMDQKTWTPLINGAQDLYSQASNIDDVREFTYTIPKMYSMIPLSGTVTCNTSCTTITGVGTFFETETKEGWYVNLPAPDVAGMELTRIITSISSNTSLVVNAAFINDHTDTQLFLVPPPTTARVATNQYLRLSGTVSTSTSNNSIIGFSAPFSPNTDINDAADSISIPSLAPNVNNYFAVGDKIFYFAPYGNSNVTGLSSNNTYYIESSNTTAITLKANTTGSKIAISGIVSSTNHVISKTNFINEAKAGDILYITGDKQQIYGVTNATHMSVGTPWTSQSSNAYAYVVGNVGLTYVNSGKNRFTTFKRFQIKVILQSDNPVRAPVLHDLRAIALQL